MRSPAHKIPLKTTLASIAAALAVLLMPAPAKAFFCFSFSIGGGPSYTFYNPTPNPFSTSWYGPTIGPGPFSNPYSRMGASPWSGYGGNPFGYANPSGFGSPFGYGMTPMGGMPMTSPWQSSPFGFSPTPMMSPWGMSQPWGQPWGMSQPWSQPWSQSYIPQWSQALAEQ